MPVSVDPVLSIGNTLAVRIGEYDGTLYKAIFGVCRAGHKQVLKTWESVMSRLWFDSFTPRQNLTL
jgi:hypothetical protein